MLKRRKCGRKLQITKKVVRSYYINHYCIKYEGVCRYI